VKESRTGTKKEPRTILKKEPLKGLKWVGGEKEVGIKPESD